MHFSITTVLAILASTAYAIPVESLETINLHNGNGTSAVTIGVPNVGASKLLEVRNPCSGSSLCSNSQGFKNDCQNAYYHLEQTTYKSGGDKSGVCAGKCGLFIEGKGCTATMGDMASAYNTIRSDGCETCGWIKEPGTRGKCQITMNYVTGC